MAKNTFVDRVNGLLTQLKAISAYTGTANEIIATDGDGLISIDLMPSGVGADTFTANASEDLVVGPVNIWNDGGTMKVRKADASATGKHCNGWVKAAVTSGNSALVYRGDITMTGMTGLTQGSVHYLSTTAGELTTTAPSANGNVIQRLGEASSTTVFLADVEEPTLISIS